MKREMSSDGVYVDYVNNVNMMRVCCFTLQNSFLMETESLILLVVEKSYEFRYAAIWLMLVAFFPLCFTSEFISS